MAITLNGSTGIQNVLGSASAPAESNTTSSNTGLYFPTSTTLGLSTAGTNALYIDASQNVGIGTTSPSAKLTVAGSVLVTAGTVYVTTTADNPGIGNNTVGATLQNGGYACFSRASPALYVNFTGTGTGTNVEFHWQGTGVGSIATTSTSTAYNTSSDYRLKNSVEPMTFGLATVAALKPVTYKWNVDDSAGEGFIAHELQAVIPHAVTGEKDAVDADGKPQYQGVDYSKIVVHLVAALQELDAKFEAYKAAHP